jgi:hypothetical protein
MRLVLWDETAGRLISFREARVSGGGQRLLKFNSHKLAANLLAPSCGLDPEPVGPLQSIRLPIDLSCGARSFAILNDV